MTAQSSAGPAARRSRPQYLGKYRGTVLPDVDPEGRGRIKVQVIGVFPVASSWAEPCFPVAGAGTGVVAVPPAGAGVWVEFERGDPDHPIWAGCYFLNTSEVPPLAQRVTPPVAAVTAQTPLGNAIQVSDAAPAKDSGGIVLRSANGVSIVVNDSGIVLSDGKGGEITIANGTVKINGGAFEVR
ncbi:phage baseplate assembly protein V [Actinoplanes sp. DH11]|uniref:phage baseplate assembly protein V n=1 Tax=Actinoplanes sp. DH11 TaxID=2857011 RepID=UPI001E6387B0|nr:phage baseplate assembly protein V [Actinoplanes sp. DH11]